MNKMIKKWNHKSVDDWGSAISDEFKEFARDFKKSLKAFSEVKLEEFYIGHYYISGFMSKDNKYVYFSYDVPRGNETIDTNQSGPYGILIRMAESIKDFRGRTNHFTNFMDFKDNVLLLFEKY